MEGAGGALGAKTEWRDFIYTRLSASWEPLRGEGAGQTRVLEVEEELKRWGREKRLEPRSPTTGGCPVGS